MTTDEEFLGEHLTYEVEMLQGSYLELQKDGHNVVVSNALIESFCIHGRQLAEFFFNKQGRRAKEFTGGSYISVHLGPVGDIATKLNTQVAHLTGKRTADAQKKIGAADRSRLLNALEMELQYFADQLELIFQRMLVLPLPITLFNTGSTAAEPIIR